jgi:hypothetical protein
MSALEYEVEPVVHCSDIDVNDVAFVRATTMIRSHDAVKEFLVCEMYPLSVGLSFKNVTDNATVVTKVVVPLPVFSCGASFEGESRSLFGEGGDRCGANFGQPQAQGT